MPPTVGASVNQSTAILRFSAQRLPTGTRCRPTSTGTSYYRYSYAYRYDVSTSRHGFPLCSTVLNLNTTPLNVLSTRGALARGHGDLRRLLHERGWQDVGQDTPVCVSHERGWQEAGRDTPASVSWHRSHTKAASSASSPPRWRADDPLRTRRGQVSVLSIRYSTTMRNRNISR